MHRHRSLLRFNDDHHLRPCRQPISHLFRDLSVALSRRDHLHHQIGRSRPIARYRPDCIQPRLAHESRIRCPHRVWVRRQPEPRFRRIHRSQSVGPARAGPTIRSPTRQSFRVHSPQASSCAPLRAPIRSETRRPVVVPSPPPWQYARQLSWAIVLDPFSFRCETLHGIYLPPFTATTSSGGHRPRTLY